MKMKMKMNEREINMMYLVKYTMFINQETEEDYSLGLFDNEIKALKAVFNDMEERNQKAINFYSITESETIEFYFKDKNKERRPYYLIQKMPINKFYYVD